MNVPVLLTGKNSPLALYTWRDGEIIVEVKGINTWVIYNEGNSVSFKKKLLVQLCQMFERVKPCTAETTPSFRT